MTREYKRIVLQLHTLVILSILLLSVGCTQTERLFEVHTINPWEYQDHQEIVKERLLFSGDDLYQVDWDNQVIRFNNNFRGIEINESLNIDDLINEKEEAMELLGEGGSSILGTASREMFGVFLDDELLYVGHFPQPLYSSYLPTGAVISDFGTCIIIGHYGVDEDLRFDDELKDYFESIGVLE